MARKKPRASVTSTPRFKTQKIAHSAKMKEFIRVNWLDIVAEEDAPKSFVDSHTPTELLAKKLNSTGYVYKEDDFAVVLCRDEDESNISYLVLPKCVITEKKYLYRAETCPVPMAPVRRGRKKPAHRRPVLRKKKRK